MDTIKIKLYNNLVSKFFFTPNTVLNLPNLQLFELSIMSTSNSNFLRKLNYFYYTYLSFKTLFFFKKKYNVSLITCYFYSYYHYLFLYFYFRRFCQRYFAKHLPYSLRYNTVKK